jgi:hypothetical protein
MTYGKKPVKTGRSLGYVREGRIVKSNRWGVARATWHTSKNMLKRMRNNKLHVFRASRQTHKKKKKTL